MADKLTAVQREVIAECIRIREGAELTAADIGRRADRKHRADVTKWERGDWGEGWKAETLIAAYASVEGIPPHAIWNRAVRAAFRRDLEAIGRQAAARQKRQS